MPGSRSLCWYKYFFHEREAALRAASVLSITVNTLTNGLLWRYNNMIYYVHGGSTYVDRGQVAGL